MKAHSLEDRLAERKKSYIQAVEQLKIWTDKAIELKGQCLELTNMIGPKEKKQ